MTFLSKTVYVCLETYGCCHLEVENIFSSMYKHIKPWTLLPGAPVKSDVLVVSGWLNTSLKAHIKKVYEQMKTDRRVVALGVCQISGSVYQNRPVDSFCIDQILPVSVFVPGCPPSPEQIISGIDMALNMNMSIQTQNRQIDVY